VGLIRSASPITITAVIANIAHKQAVLRPIANCC
jgi:hypothetical protein